MNQDQIDSLEFTGDLEDYYQIQREYHEWLESLEPEDFEREVDKTKYVGCVDASTD